MRGGPPRAHVARRARRRGRGVGQSRPVRRRRVAYSSRRNSRSWRRPGFAGSPTMPPRPATRRPSRSSNSPSRRCVRSSRKLRPRSKPSPNVSWLPATPAAPAEVRREGAPHVAHVARCAAYVGGRCAVQVAGEQHAGAIRCVDKRGELLGDGDAEQLRALALCARRHALQVGRDDERIEVAGQAIDGAAVHGQIALGCLAGACSCEVADECHGLGIDRGDANQGRRVTDRRGSARTRSRTPRIGARSRLSSRQLGLRLVVLEPRRAHQQEDRERRVGDGVVDQLAGTLARRYSGLRGFARPNLFRMRQFSRRTATTQESHHC